MDEEKLKILTGSIAVSRAVDLCPGAPQCISRVCEAIHIGDATYGINDLLLCAVCVQIELHICCITGEKKPIINGKAKLKEDRITGKKQQQKKKKHPKKHNRLW